MADRLNITETRSGNLKRICNLDLASLFTLSKKLNEFPSSVLYKKELNSIFVEEIHDSELANLLLHTIIGFASAARDKNLTADETIQLVKVSLEGAGWDKADLSKWNKISEAMKAILSSKPICNVVKVIDLTYDYEKLYERARVLTDIRPIFDDERSEISGALIAQSLSLHYFNDSGQHSITLALDEKDVISLMDSCEMALRKAQEIKKMFDTKVGIKTIIVGGSENEPG